VGRKPGWRVAWRCLERVSPEAQCRGGYPTWKEHIGNTTGRLIKLAMGIALATPIRDHWALHHNGRANIRATIRKLFTKGVRWVQTSYIDWAQSLSGEKIGKSIYSHHARTMCGLWKMLLLISHVDALRHRCTPSSNASTTVGDLY
jgi:hypothetical protein